MTQLNTQSLLSVGGLTVLQSLAVMKTEAQQILQAMSPAQKLRAAERLYYSARQLKAAALPAEHPDWTDELSVKPCATGAQELTTTPDAVLARSSLVTASSRL